MEEKARLEIQDQLDKLVLKVGKDSQDILEISKANIEFFDSF